MENDRERSGSKLANVAPFSCPGRDPVLQEHDGGRPVDDGRAEGEVDLARGVAPVLREGRAQRRREDDAVEAEDDGLDQDDVHAHREHGHAPPDPDDLGAVHEAHVEGEGENEVDETEADDGDDGPAAADFEERRVLGGLGGIDVLVLVETVVDALLDGVEPLDADVDEHLLLRLQHRRTLGDLLGPGVGLGVDVEEADVDLGRARVRRWPTF